jgi:hypothetical protein
MWNYHSTLRKIPKERKSHLLRGGSLKLGVRVIVCNVELPSVKLNFTSGACLTSHSARSLVVVLDKLQFKTI